MSDYAVRQFDDPDLRVVCRDVPQGHDVYELLRAMHMVILDYNGIGLAAPQVGSDLRVIVVGRQTGNINLYTAMVNPKILKLSEQSNFAYEGCLSYPGVEAWVKRHKRVKIAYTDLSGCATRRSLAGHEARVLQHELDHLEGICRVGDEWRRQLIRTPSAEAKR